MWAGERGARVNQNRTVGRGFKFWSFCNNVIFESPLTVSLFSTILKTFMWSLRETLTNHFSRNINPSNGNFSIQLKEFFASALYKGSLMISGLGSPDGDPFKWEVHPCYSTQNLPKNDSLTNTRYVQFFGKFCTRAK